MRSRHGRGCRKPEGRLTHVGSRNGHSRALLNRIPAPFHATHLSKSASLLSAGYLVAPLALDALSLASDAASNTASSGTSVDQTSKSNLGIFWSSSCAPEMKLRRLAGRNRFFFSFFSLPGLGGCQQRGSVVTSILPGLRARPPSGAPFLLATAVWHVRALFRFSPT